MESPSVRLLRLWWQRFNDEGEPPLELCDPEIEITNPPTFPVRGTFRGHEGVRDWRDQAFDIVDDLRVELEEVHESDDGAVVTFLRLQGVARHTRIEFDEPWAAVMTVRDGKVLSAKGYVSRDSAMEAARLTR